MVRAIKNDFVKIQLTKYILFKEILGYIEYRVTPLSRARNSPLYYACKSCSLCTMIYKPKDLIFNV